MPAKTLFDRKWKFTYRQLLGYYSNSFNVNYMAELSRNKIGSDGFKVCKDNERNGNFHIYNLNNLNFWPGINTMK